ncbi:aldose 1-epimerase family protein [Belnapia sp. T18]|uniref:Aldose 1-epimerase family protein n=1 Tax=Belnapia arida TaxID=2804533 RepID=A0ABS1TYR4_9PROT|nr:aldose 1-epimerase family protein [Belnapia arida]MBL6077585.1 aldose 1-epimerase family protein [Belnapia arida]
MIQIASDALTAAIKPEGAELCRLRDAAGREFLWNAGPAWPRHAPVLFPIVGRLAGDGLNHAGRRYPMRQHGFARDRTFTLIDQAPDRCAFRLTDGAETHAAYPFAFALDIHYAVAGGRLSADYRLSNPGPEPLPASLGAHPAFRWPLPGAEGRPHALSFESDEPAPIRRLQDGLLLPEPQPSPIEGRRLALSPALFEADAMILDQPHSRAVEYRAEGGPRGGSGLRFAFTGFPHLGLWSKPGGADFLCIEPWQGFASPLGWDGEFTDKPGLVTLPPGGEFRAGWSVELL